MCFSERIKYNTNEQLQLAFLRTATHWPTQVNSKSENTSWYNRNKQNEKNEMEILFEGKPINPAKENVKSPAEPAQNIYTNFYTLSQQVYASMDYYIQKVNAQKGKNKQVYEHIAKAWPIKSGTLVPMQYISGSRWDFIFDVQLQDNTYLLGYLQSAYKK